MISVVIPVFRGQQTLRTLYRRAAAVLDALDVEFEIIFVEDCGGDSSWTLIYALAQEDHRVLGLRLARNYGQHNALLCGIRAASGDIIVTLDDDLQNPPEEMPKLLDKLAEGYDVVYGAPARAQHGLLRNYASRVTKLALQQALGAATAGKVSAYRAFRTHVVRSFENYCSPTVNVDVLLTWGASRFAAVTVEQHARADGASGYTTRKLLEHALNMMTGFSTLPLRIASILGFLFGGMGFLVLGYVVGRYLLFGSTVQGFTFIASIVAIFSGVQLITLGIIGEYMARMHFRTMERPAYVIAQSTREPPPVAAAVTLRRDASAQLQR